MDTTNAQLMEEIKHNPIDMVIPDLLLYLTTRNSADKLKCVVESLLQWKENEMCDYRDKAGNSILHCIFNSFNTNCNFLSCERDRDIFYYCVNKLLSLRIDPHVENHKGENILGIMIKKSAETLIHWLTVEQLLPLSGSDVYKEMETVCADCLRMVICKFRINTPEHLRAPYETNGTQENFFVMIIHTIDFQIQNAVKLGTRAKFVIAKCQGLICTLFANVIFSDSLHPGIVSFIYTAAVDAEFIHKLQDCFGRTHSRFRLAYPRLLWSSSERYRDVMNELELHCGTDILQGVVEPKYGMFHSNHQELSNHIRNLWLYSPRQKFLAIKQITDYHLHVDNAIHMITMKADIDEDKFKRLVAMKTTLQELETLVKTIRPLTLCCCLNIRRNVDSYDVEILPLPKVLKNYVSFGYLTAYTERFEYSEICG